MPPILLSLFSRLSEGMHLHDIVFPEPLLHSETPTFEVPFRPKTKADTPTTTERSKEDIRAPIAASQAVYDAWVASRAVPGDPDALLVAGTLRKLTLQNARFAWIITRECAIDLFLLLFRLNPIRTMLMMTLSLARSLSPAFRGYWQALALNELQSLIISRQFTWTYLARLVLTELIRRLVEGLLELFASSNETLVHSSARFWVEYQQLEQRVRLDIPTLADPVVRDLLQESELFTKSFNGMGGFGLLSPFDFIHIFSTFAEIISHVWVVFSLVGGTTHLAILLLSILSSVLPWFISWLSFSHNHADSLYTPQESRAAERQEKMRNLAYSDSHRPEILLFGLGPWILRSWASARKLLMETERHSLNSSSGLSLLSHFDTSDIIFALQNIPLVLMLQSSSGSLGSLTLFRSSIQSIVFGVSNLTNTTRMAFQGIFLMGAFCSAMGIKPKLHPTPDEAVAYKGVRGGVRFEVRNLCYTYPGGKQPALHNLNFILDAGQTLAIVGYNGSGKSTLAKILLRIISPDSGQVLVNGKDISLYNPVDYHRHVTAVFQGFAKFNSTLKENVGVGFVDKLTSKVEVERAVRLAGAEGIVSALPNGLKTRLDTSGFDSVPFAPFADSSQSHIQHGLSGGEWQRVAISRAFMRATRPEIDLILFDEPTSSLDAHAQNKIFDTIEEISRSPNGERMKTVIFITHRLSTARRADKVAMMENGTITEFGTHDELRGADGAYAALYQASV